MKWKNKGHEYDGIGAVFQKNNVLYLWGTTNVAADFAIRAQKLNLQVRIIDESGLWCSTGWCGLDVVSPSVVFNNPEGKTVLVALPGQELELILDSVVTRLQMWYNVIEHKAINRKKDGITKWNPITDTI